MKENEKLENIAKVRGEVGSTLKIAALLDIAVVIFQVCFAALAEHGPIKAAEIPLANIICT